MKLPPDPGWMGDPRRGASLGRASSPAGNGETIVRKFTLRHVRLNNGGYDSGGTYWGLGPRLYWAASECGGISCYIRARDRQAAKDTIRNRYPGARFYQ